MAPMKHQARPRRAGFVAVAVGVALTLWSVPLVAGSRPLGLDPSTTVTTSPSTSTTDPAPTSSTTGAVPPTTTVPTLPWPEPASGTCSPNWYRGFLLGDRVEHGEVPAGAEGAARPASDFGAVVAITGRLVEDGGETGVSSSEIELDIAVGGRRYQLSTAPHPAYGHYANRTPGPLEVDGGTLGVAQVDGRTWVLFGQNTSGATGDFAWDLGSCVPVRAAGVPEAPRSEPVPGRSEYTG